MHLGTVTRASTWINNTSGQSIAPGPFFFPRCYNPICRNQSIPNQRKNLKPTTLFQRLLPIERPSIKHRNVSSTKDDRNSQRYCLSVMRSVTRQWGFTFSILRIVGNMPLYVPVLTNTLLVLQRLGPRFKNSANGYGQFSQFGTAWP